MDRCSPLPFAFAAVPHEAAREALELIFGHLGPEQRSTQVADMLAELGGGPVSPTRLWGVYRGERLVGAMVWQVQPGRTALLWPPRVRSEEQRIAATELVAASLRSLVDEGVQVVFALLPPGDGEDTAPLVAAGFRHLADLLYLVVQQSQFPPTLLPSELSYEPYTPENHRRLASMVQATYVGTRDCPGLEIVRDIEDILAGHRATGVFSAERWLLIRWHGQDVGCLLLADHPEQANWELVYMGIAPEHRGRGWGMQVARYAQWLAGKSGRAGLVLAVDATNGPAIRAYAEVGFEAFDERSVWYRGLSPVGTRPQ